MGQLVTLARRDLEAVMPEPNQFDGSLLVDALEKAVRAESSANGAHHRLDRMNGSIDKLSANVAKVGDEVSSAREVLAREIAAARTETATAVAGVVTDVAKQGVRVGIIAAVSAAVLTAILSGIVALIVFAVTG